MNFSELVKKDDWSTEKMNINTRILFNMWLFNVDSYTARLMLIDRDVY